MFERFTENAVKVIMVAQEESRRLKRNWVAPEQILLGVLSVNKSHAARVMASHGLKLDGARKDVLAAVGKGDDRLEAEIHFTDAAKRGLELCWAAAQNRESGAITEDHIMLGLLALNDPVTSGIIRKYCSSISLIEEELNRSMDGK
ncbi:MAG: hypothetical protein JST01_21820 [Cyanobacteria bacterium SZAS TMP-1]|nr:hypothetical protein [Cyanobacteria bacterium SZAS TMP-1]